MPIDDRPFAARKASGRVHDSLVSVVTIARLASSKRKRNKGAGSAAFRRGVARINGHRDKMVFMHAHDDVY
jgi:hypothetical protein